MSIISHILSLFCIRLSQLRIQFMEGSSFDSNMAEILPKMTASPIQLIKADSAEIVPKYLMENTFAHYRKAHPPVPYHRCQSTCKGVMCFCPLRQQQLHPTRKTCTQTKTRNMTKADTLLSFVLFAWALSACLLSDTVSGRNR